MDPDTVCRACLINTNKTNKFSAVVYESLTLLEVLKYCLSFEKEDENFPQNLCFDCTDTLCRFYDLKLSFVRNEQILKAQIEDLLTSQRPLNEDVKDTNDSPEELLLKEDETFDPGVDDDTNIDNSFDLKDSDYPPEEEIINALKHKCVVCYKYFPDKEYLAEHYAQHKKHICDECGASFLKKSYLTDHKISHSNVRKFVCPFCGMKFKRRSIFASHKRNHTNPREFVCETCGKRFNSKSTMKTHVKLLHIKNRDFMCNLCGLTFPLKASLQKHISRHNKNTPKLFKCSECEMSYKDKSSLTRHVQIKHSEDKRSYRCEPCNKEYTTNTNLLKHIRKKHADNIKESNNKTFQINL